MNMKTTQGSIRPRSATAPTARATLYTVSAAVRLPGSRSEDVRDGSEHALVNSEHEIRNLVAADRWCSEDISEANVIEISDELAG